MNNSFDVNILINGNRCKFYHHNGKIYIESKHGSEYELEIKNNTYARVLALASVDGLSVLNGGTASDEDPGYVIPGYSPLKIKGFRYSNDSVAAFKFTNKENSYAQSTGGSESAQNCGIIGFKIFCELYKPIITSSPTILYRNDNDPYYGEIIGSNCFGFAPSQTLCSSVEYGAVVASSDDKCLNFDMGSGWGQKLESKVIDTEFIRGHLVFNLDIYYASRQSLINMGVPIQSGNQVSFPKSFPNKYAKPPSNWRG